MGVKRMTLCITIINCQTINFAGDVNSLATVRIHNGSMCFGKSTDPRFHIQNITVNIATLLRNYTMSVTDGSECLPIRLDDLNPSLCNMFEVVIDVYLEHQLPISKIHYFYNDGEEMRGKL